MNKKFRCLLVSLIFTAMWNGTTIQAQAPHPERIYLSGTGIDNTKTWDFFCSAGQNSGKWKKIEVPCNWELQGFGEYTYGRWYTIKGQRPSDETGTYRYKFDAPKSWAGQRVKIFFDGVMTDAEIMINGKPAGEMHQGGFYRFNYDITELLNLGKKNQLEVKVAKESANRSINAAERKADWWLFGGIYRPVWLEVLPQVHMEHFVLNADHHGKLQTAVDMAGDAKGHEIIVSVRSLKDGKTVYTSNGQTTITHPINNSDKEQMISGEWASIIPWSTENPNLYVAKLELKNPEGKIVQTRETRIGFRTVEFFPQDGVYLNGTKLVVKGINRHSFSVDGGRTTSAALSRMDALLIKEMNMNAVRSHYPPDEHFLDMCDSLGLVYMDELAGWQNGYDSKVGAKLVKEMIERDVNHPCIILWSNGNEGGWNTQTDPLFAQYDRLQKRHMVHPWADFNDLDTHHYPTYLTGVARFTNGYKVFMPTEFMHAMYDQGGGAGLRDFWDRWCTNPLFAGGFIWVYCDGVLILLCAIGFSAHIMVIDYFSPRVNGIALSCIQFLVCAVVSLPFMFSLEHPEMAAILSAWLPILYAGVLSCGVAYTLQIIGQRNVNPTIASLILSLESCFSVLAGWVILHESLSIKESAGCVLMFAAIILAQLPSKIK